MFNMGTNKQVSANTKDAIIAMRNLGHMQHEIAAS